MPDLAETRRLLEARLVRLGARVEKIEGDLRQPGNPDWQEHATESENDEVRERLGEAERAEIGEIRAALSRVEAGTYGTCAECGEPIAEERLRAVPYAAACRDCAE